VRAQWCSRLIAGPAMSEVMLEGKTSSGGDPYVVLQSIAGLVLQFLESKSFFAAQRALNAELALLCEREGQAPGQKVSQTNLFTSDLEKRLNLLVGGTQPNTAQTISDHTVGSVSSNGTDEEQGPEALQSLMDRAGQASTRPRLRVYTYHLYSTQKDESTLRKRFGEGTPQQRVLFHDPPKMRSQHEADLACVSLPVIFNPHVNGLEDDSEVQIDVNTVIIGRYRVIALIGKGSFSRVFQCLDLESHRMVSVKVIRNEKDCFDAGLGEIKVLSLLAKHDPNGQLARLQLLDYFYYKEHLLIVTELLRDSLFQFYKYVDATEPAGLRAYFTPKCIGRISHQLLHCLQFLHSHGLKHCDVKPENVCLASARRGTVKLIDFGSSLLTYDTTNSYVQSRWYRAPEVVLGIPWDGKVDIWSLGCLLCELLLGQPIFYGASVAATLAAQQALLGPHPTSLLEKANHDLRRMYFGPGGTLYVVSPSGRPEGVYELRPARQPLADVLEVDEPELVDFISSLLTYDPAKRPSASEALQHPWMRKQSSAYREHLERMEEHARRPTSLTLEQSVALGVEGLDGFGTIGRRFSPAPSTGPSTQGSPRSGSPRSGSPRSDSPRSGSPVDDRVAGRSQRQFRASSETFASGPGVPEEFRAAIRSNGDGSRSHDLRSRFMRFLAKAPGSSQGASVGIEPTTTSASSGRDSPLCCENGMPDWPLLNTAPADGDRSPAHGSELPTAPKAAVGWTRRLGSQTPAEEQMSASTSASAQGQGAGGDKIAGGRMRDPRVATEGKLRASASPILSGRTVNGLSGGGGGGVGGGAGSDDEAVPVGSSSADLVKPAPLKVGLAASIEIADDSVERSPQPKHLGGARKKR